MQDSHISQEQADEYAIGSLDPALERVITLHLAECSACRDVVHDSERLAARVAMSTPTRPPSDRLRKRVFTSVGLARPSLASRLFAYGRAASTLGAVVVALLAFTAMLGIRSQVDTLREENADLQRQIDDVSSAPVELAAVTRKLADQSVAAAAMEADSRQDRELLVALTSDQSKIAEVVAVNETESAIGSLVWDETQKKVWFMATGMSVPAVGKTYQLWANSNGRYVALGSFIPDNSGFVRFSTEVAEGLTNYESAVVTIENSGGVTERSGPPVFVANLEGLRR